MKQTWLGSSIEQAVQLAFGFVIATAVTYYVLPLWGFRPTPGHALQITLLYTAVSFVRGVIVRQFFEALRHKKMRKRGGKDE